MRPIDADKLKGIKFNSISNDRYGAYRLGWNDAINAIVDNAPTADVVEVVRCKDCKYYTLKPQQTSRVTSVRRCNRSAIVCTKPDDFCSFGERKK